MNLDNPFFNILIFLGIIFLLAGFILYKYPPKSINLSSINIWVNNISKKDRFLVN